MAETLLVGALVGAVFGELLKAVMEMKDKATKFKPTMANLAKTLTAIDPLIKEMKLQNDELGRKKEELESLKKVMEEGTKLVHRCSKIHWLTICGRIQYQEQLVELRESLERFFKIDMPAQTARDVKEVFLKQVHTERDVKEGLLMQAHTEKTLLGMNDTLLHMKKTLIEEFKGMRSDLNSKLPLVSTYVQPNDGNEIKSEEAIQPAKESVQSHSTSHVHKDSQVSSYILLPRL